MIEGHFIVLEGIDGAGTSTQALELKRRFSEMGLPAHVTAEPSQGPIGAIIRQVLSGRLVTRLHQTTAPLNWKLMALLFAADRIDHVESEIQPNLREGVNVLCDRYVYSSIVYQNSSSERQDAGPWIAEINRFIRRPDLVLYLRVDPRVARERCQARDSKTEIYDDPEFQQKLSRSYDALVEAIQDVPIAVIDGNRSVGEVTAECWTHVERLRSGGRA